MSELLIIVAILLVLAAMLVPVVGPPRERPTPRAMIEMSLITAAICDYEAAYGQYPVSANAVASAAITSGDFTYGTFGAASKIKYPDGALAVIDNAAGNYHANNAEVIAILLDLTNYPNGQPTCNQGHARNPQHIKFLNATLTEHLTSPGVGLDGVFRDPWGNPYIVTIDLNQDGKARDAYYSLPGVSQDASGGGINGLVKTSVGSNTFYELKEPVMVWSAGPDKKIERPNATGPGNASSGANKDNLVSWAH
jgi:hypothetical protein